MNSHVQHCHSSDLTRLCDWPRSKLASFLLWPGISEPHLVILEMFSGSPHMCNTESLFVGLIPQVGVTLIKFNAMPASFCMLARVALDGTSELSGGHKEVVRGGLKERSDG